MQISNALKAWFEDYEKFHRHPSNKTTHYIGIPMIMISILGLAALVDIGPLNLAMILFALVSLWAITLDFRFGLLFAIASIPLYAIGVLLSWPLNLAFFVIGWIFQLVGHFKFEKRSPALTQNFLQTFIGPMWILAKIIGARR